MSGKTKSILAQIILSLSVLCSLLYMSIVREEYSILIISILLPVIVLSIIFYYKAKK